MSISNLSDHPRFDAGRPDHAWYAGDPRRTVRVDARTVVVEQHVIREINGSILLTTRLDLTTLCDGEIASLTRHPAGTGR